MAKLSPLMIAPPLIFAGIGLMFFLGLGRDGKDRLDLDVRGQTGPRDDRCCLDRL